MSRRVSIDKTVWAIYWIFGENLVVSLLELSLSKCNCYSDGNICRTYFVSFSGRSEPLFSFLQPEFSVPWIVSVLCFTCFRVRPNSWKTSGLPRITSR